jgi:hypothetical protein
MRILKNDENSIRHYRRVLIGFFAIFSVANLYFLVGRINSSESRLFPEGTNIHHGWPWRNGDHMYYVSSAIEMSGIGYTKALLLTAEIFSDWPGWYQDLDLGFQSLDSAPLIYARSVLPLSMALGYKVFGAAGLALPTLIAALIATVALLRWMYIQRGALLASSALVVMSGSLLFVKYGTGIFTESFLILITVLWLYLLPFSEKSRKHGYAIAGFVISIFILGFVRQVPLLPLSVLFMGWFSSLLITRKFFNVWFSYAMAGGIATVATYFVVSRWAPLGGYTPSTLSQSTSAISNRAGTEGYTSIWGWAKFGIQYTTENILVADKFMLALLPLFFLGSWNLRRTAMPYVALGVIATSAPYLLAAYPEYRFFSTGIVFFLVVCAFGLYALIPKMLKQDEIDTGSSGFNNGSEKSIKIVTISLIAVVIVQLMATIYVYRPNTSDLVMSEPVGVAFPALINQEGQLECYGNNAQVWLITPDGKRYAVSGTALSHGYNSLKATSAKQKIARYMTYEATSPFIKRCLAKADSSRQ